MQATVLFVCLSFCLTAWETNGQVGSLCRANERLLQCGCPKTCRDPAPSCEGVCKEGCFCEEGQVRDEWGNCVKLEDCPRLISHFKELNTSEPLADGGICPENEEYRFCEPCNRTCDTPNPICPAQCARGCFCKGKLLRDADGRCVEWGQCSNVLQQIRRLEKEKSYMPARFSCGPNKEYKTCEKCIRSCVDREPHCYDGDHCRSGCFCKDGLFKNLDGQCVTLEECDYDVSVLQV